MHRNCFGLTRVSMRYASSPMAGGLLLLWRMGLCIRNIHVTNFVLQASFIWLRKWHASSPMTGAYFFLGNIMIFVLGMSTSL